MMTGMLSHYAIQNNNKGWKRSRRPAALQGLELERLVFPLVPRAVSDRTDQKSTINFTSGSLSRFKFRFSSPFQGRVHLFAKM
jgi:hypothetical protein